MQNGGKRDGAGRKQGSINKVKLELREAAKAYTQQALDTLVKIMGDNSMPAAARISAANILLDRGHGKPSQALDVAHSGDINHLIVRWTESDGDGHAVDHD